MKIILSPNADEQLWEITNWWDEHRPSARVRIEDAFVESIGALLKHPHLGIADELPSIRRARLRGTPFMLFYEVHDEMLTVLAVWHSSRGSRPPL